MPSKRPRDTKIQPPQSASNFRLINGINRIIENRLHAAGILSFEQLAALSPQEIVQRIGHLAGVNIERVTEQDWVGQASTLQTKSNVTELHSDLTNVGFVVDLFLNRQKEVQLTQVLNVKSGEGEAWNGWDETRLIDFFTTHVGLSPTSETVTVESSESDSEIEAAAVPILLPAAPASALLSPGIQESIAATTAIKMELQTLSPQTHSPTSLFAKGEPFAVQLLLHVGEQFKSQDTPINYTASVFAKKLEDQSRHTLGRESGVIKPSETSIRVQVPSRGLESGVYNLTATLLVTSLEAGTPPNPIMQSSLTGNTVQIL